MLLFFVMLSNVMLLICYGGWLFCFLCCVADFDETRKLKEGIIIDSAWYYSTSLGVGAEPVSQIYLSTYSKLIAVSDKIDFQNVGNLPEVIDVSQCCEVTFRNCNFTECRELKLGEML